MPVNIYRHTDPGAPVLTGQVGTLVAVLDACLVNGYGAKVAAGWTKAFSAANKAAYRQNAAGANNAANPMYLYVDDTGPGAGSAREARCCGFETMTAITPTGTGQFPTAGQSNVPGGMLVCRKSSTADATARGWTLVANGQSLHLFTESGDHTFPLATAGFFFGDIRSLKPVDPYAVMIIGRQVENVGTAQYDPYAALGLPDRGSEYSVANWGQFGHYIARSWTGNSGSVRASKTTDISRVFNTGNSAPGSVNMALTEANQSLTTGGYMWLNRINRPYGLPTPNPVDGSLMLMPVWICHSGAVRGYLPGVWNSFHDRPLQHNDSFTVVGGNMNGKQLLGINVQANVSAFTTGDNAVAIMETSDTWS